MYCTTSMEHRRSHQRPIAFPNFSLSYFVTEKYSNFNIRTVPVRNKGFKIEQTKDQKKTIWCTNLSALQTPATKGEHRNYNSFPFILSHPDTGVSRFTGIQFQRLSSNNVILTLALVKLSKSKVFWWCIPSPLSFCNNSER